MIAALDELPKGMRSWAIAQALKSLPGIAKRLHELEERVSRLDEEGASGLDEDGSDNRVRVEAEVKQSLDSLFESSRV